MVVGVVRNCKKEWLDDSRREESIHLEVAKAQLFAEYIKEVQPGIIESIETNQWPDWAIQLLPIIPDYNTGEIPDSPEEEPTIIILEDAGLCNCPANEKSITKSKELLNYKMRIKTMMENFNTPSDIINETMNEMQNNHSFSYKAIFQNYANALLRNAIFGLIVAGILKKS